MPRWQRAFLLAGFLVVLAGTTFFVYLYLHFSRLIDERMGGEVFNHASMVFSAPTPVSVGQPWTPERVASRLRKALYSEGEGAAGFGSYRVRGDRLEIRPGPASFFEGGPIREGPAALEFHEGKLASISSLEGGSSLEGYWLERPGRHVTRQSSEQAARARAVSDPIRRARRPQTTGYEPRTFSVWTRPPSASSASRTRGSSTAPSRSAKNM